MKKLLLLLFLIYVSFTFGFKVTFIIYVPENTPENSEIYISGNFNNWSVNDEDFKLIKKENYYMLETNLSGIIKFIITRGSTDTTEIIEKYRIARVSKDNIQIIARVKRWKDLIGKIELIKDFYSPELNNKRNIIIYLPPGYEKDTKSYPVLYLHDGQNLFDKKTAFVGVEWEIDETLDRMISNKEIEPLIVVGIYNNADRLSEYSPWYYEEYKQGGKGDKYLEFIVKTLKPFVDEKYRTISDKNYIGGSSMGGLISLYGISKYPDVFSGAIVMSPSFFFGNSKIFDFVDKNPPVNSRIYLYVGGKESENERFLEEAIEMKKLLENLNVNVKYSFDPEGVHSEAFWAKRFPEAIKWILEGTN